MKIKWREIRIFIKPGPTDMRKQINGLSILVEEELQKDPFNGHLYIFCSRNRKRLKIIYWDRNGFCLWLKRLERDKFPWPMTEEECREITSQELAMILDGINFFKAHKKLNFFKVS